MGGGQASRLKIKEASRRQPGHCSKRDIGINVEWKRKWKLLLHLGCGVEGFPKCEGQDEGVGICGGWGFAVRFYIEGSAFGHMARFCNRVTALLVRAMAKNFK